MSLLDQFYSCEENQRKYGFQYSKTPDGVVSIFYDGEIDTLMQIAYSSLGYERLEAKSPRNPVDSRPELLLEYTEETGIIIKDSGASATVDVDGEGDEPNFFLRYSDKDKEVIIRFNMIVPEIYPDNDCLTCHLALSSLTAVNELFRDKCDEFVKKWNRLRPDCPMKLNFIPNYRAINRLC